MPQDKGPRTAPDYGAEAALELLKSLAVAGNDTEKFTQACSDWARLSGDAAALPEFQSIVDQLAGHSNSSDRSPGGPNRYNAQNVIGLDSKGLILDISGELSDFLRLKKGDTLDVPHPTFFTRQSSPKYAIIEQKDRFEITRKFKLVPSFDDRRLTGINAVIGLFRVSDEVLSHLRLNFDLTHSEIEVLTLTLRRLKLQQIADYRQISLNTVRTHVARATNKLSCHSLTEAVTTLRELSEVIDRDVKKIEALPDKSSLIARNILLPSSNQKVEYRRFGPSNGRPVIMLHSLEYGYLPSQNMIEDARNRNINLIFPIRPGFGETVKAESERGSARIINEFTAALNLSSVTLVGISTSAPVALMAANQNKRVSRLVLVNYGLNVADKLAKIEPNWVRGLLRMALNSTASFRIGLAALRSIVRSYGGQRFYQRLYRGQRADEHYLKENSEKFKLFTSYILSADPSSVRRDIVSAFLPNSAAESALKSTSRVRVINGSNQHGVDVSDSRDDALRLGVDFKEASYEGRNWLFRNPKAFFDAALEPW